MNHWRGSLICALVSLALLFCGLLVPAHLRAVDGIVLQRAGRGTPVLSEAGLSLVKDNQLGAAQMVLEAAQSARLADADRLAGAVGELARRQPHLRISGADEPGTLGAWLRSTHDARESGTNQPALAAEPFTGIIVHEASRTRALEFLQASPGALAQALLRLRSLTNTVLFPSSASSSGQALDAAISICGLLNEAGHLSRGLSNSVLVMATEAGRAGNSQPVEQVLLDLMSLGQRFNWGQLATIVGPVNDVETLRALSSLMRRGESVPVVYAAVCLTGDAAGVAKYLTNFSETGPDDLRSSLKYGAGGVRELVHRNQRLCDSGVCAWVASLGTAGSGFAFALDYSWRKPMLGLAGKWLLYLSGGFFAAAAVHFARRVTRLEQPLEVRGFHLAREFLFALGFLLVVLLLGEPFLSQGSQQGALALPFQLRLPTVGAAVPAGSPGTPTTIMNPVTLLTMVLFFVLQSLLYVASLVKLAEIRRQRVSSRMKLKLLENEDHLFDAGLYLGFLGTIISLILVSLGVFKQPSLMAAYSATSFGILFVVLFKVVHLRRMRRHLLLEAETESSSRAALPAESTLVAPL